MSIYYIIQYNKDISMNLNSILDAYFHVWSLTSHFLIVTEACVHCTLCRLYAYCPMIFHMVAISNQPSSSTYLIYTGATISQSYCRRFQIVVSCIPDRNFVSLNGARQCLLAYPTGISVNPTGARKCCLT